LRDNKSEGKIPQDIFNLSKLYHLDSTENQLSGSTPKCIGNMTCMIKDELGSVPFSTMVDLVTKGQSYVFMYNTYS